MLEVYNSPVHDEPSRSILFLAESPHPVDGPVLAVAAHAEVVGVRAGHVIPVVGFGRLFECGAVLGIAYPLGVEICEVQWIALGN